MPCPQTHTTVHRGDDRVSGLFLAVIFRALLRADFVELIWVKLRVRRRNTPEEVSTTNPSVVPQHELRAVPVALML